MPQMAPLNWLTLMVMFMVILAAFIMTIFFSFKSAKPLKTNKIPLTKSNWKW